MMPVRRVALAFAAVLPCFACQPSGQPRSGADAAAPSAPPAASAAASPALTSAQIDEVIRGEWARAHVAPAPRTDDARFLRRVYLDVVGTVPPPEVVLSFTADPSPSAEKRARVVDSLLASPAYAEHWSRYWSEALLGNAKDGLVDRPAFQKWLAARFAAGAPWNRVVAELLAAQGQNGEPGAAPPASSAGGTGWVPPPAMGASPSREMMAEEEGAASMGPVNGAVNWFIRYREAPQDLAGNVSRVFLGVQIQCAQCHDHKTEKWKQEDFRSFASCFMRTRAEVDKTKAMTGAKRASVVDVGRPLARYTKNPELAPVAQARPRALDGTDLSRSTNTRQALAAWITAKENPWFAQAIVNRMWAHFLGRGFIDPIDDIRPSSAVTAPELLSRLSADFVAQGYDLKHLIRLITAAEVYQVSAAGRPPGAQGDASAPPAAVLEQDRLWPRFRIEPLGPEELLNALLDSTGVEATLRRTTKFQIDIERVRRQLFDAYAYLFDVDEEFDQSDFAGTVSQGLALLNGTLVGGGTAGLPGSALDAILARPDSDAQKIAALYLRTVSRPPAPEETAYFVRYVNEAHDDAVTPPAGGPGAAGRGPLARLRAMRAQAKAGKKGAPDTAGPAPLARLEAQDSRTADPKRRAYEDVFWALLNSSEFTFNH